MLEVFVSHGSYAATNSDKEVKVPRKPIETARFLTSRLPIQPVRDRICRDFERGIGMRSIGASYQCCAGVVEEVVRLRLRELEAAGRARVIEMRPGMRKAA